MDYHMFCNYFRKHYNMWRLNNIHRDIVYNLYYSHKRDILKSKQNRLVHLDNMNLHNLCKLKMKYNLNKEIYKQGMSLIANNNRRDSLYKYNRHSQEMNIRYNLQDKGHIRW